ncbi:MAG: hypothetical protein QM733_23400 [Ilumatobacteraceae bacterium]
MFSFDLDEIASLEAKAPFLRRRAKALTLELRGASWGAVGIAVIGALERHTGVHQAPLHRRADTSPLVARLAQTAHA